MQLDRGDMQLLIEAGYSSVMRGVDADAGTIFRAIDEWMPQYASGAIGLALQQMVAGDFAGADEALTAILASGREGRNEAAAVLAMCKQLQHQTEAARRLAADLEGTGGHAEEFTRLLVHGPDETTQGDQGLAMEAAAAPARGGDDETPRASDQKVEINGTS